MEAMNLAKALDIAIAAARKASERILAVYRTDFSASVEYKRDQSPLTLADTASNEIILKELRVAFPDIPILSEESAQDVSLDAPYCWIVDPLDGTKEFIKKNGEFTVNIGLVKAHRPVLGVVAVPVTGEIFFAAKGLGAWSEKDGAREPLRVSNKITELVWVGSKSHSSEKERALIGAHSAAISETRSAGSSLKGVMVARGMADVYYRFGPTCEWDTCAMHCVAELAGGVVRQMDGSELLYNRADHLNAKGFYIVNREENVWV